MNEKEIETNHSDYRKAASGISESLIVCAAAGTGKTTVLVNRYLEILRKHAAGIDQIAAITFTEKAANEMKERIRAELSKTDFICPQELRGNLIDQVNLAPISTVHAFCGRVLRDNVFLLELDPLFTISDETEEKIQRADFTERFLNDRLKSDNPEIPALLEVMELSQIDTLLNVVWNKRAECSDLMNHIRTTSDDTLLKEMKTLHKEITHQVLSEFFDDTENIKAIAQLRAISRPKNGDKLQDCLDLIFKAESEWKTGNIFIDSLKSDMKTAFDGRIKGSEKVWSGDLETVRNLRLQLGERWKTIDNILFDFVEETEKTQIRLLKYFVVLAGIYIDSYRQTMFASGRIDFGSLETEMVRLLSGKSEQIRRYVSRFSHLLVDEFQDINPIQHRIIELLCELNPDIVTFFVGDEKQSIYRFRGSEVEIFNRLKNKRTPLRLDLNFRSVPGLMAFFNDFFPFVLGKDQPKETFEANYPVPIDPYFKESTDSIPVEILIVKDDESLDNEDKTEDTIVSADTFTSELSEATFVAEKIQELVGKPVAKIKAEPIREAKFGDMVVLLRSRTHQLEIESTFRKFGIPFYVASGIGFYDRREVQDVVNFLKVLLNFYDEVALITVLRSPMFGISDYTLTKFSSESGLFEGIRYYFSETLSKPVQLKSEEKIRLDRFWLVYLDLQKSLSGMTTAEILMKIISVTDYLTIVGSLADGDQAVANIQKLCGLALEWSDAGNISPIDFIRRIGIFRSIEVREGEANLSSETGNAVAIMTVHASKGLDFPIVFVPFLSSKFNVNKDRLVFHPGEGMALSLKAPFDDNQSFLFKYLKNRDGKRLKAEEKRLLYVAATRAQSMLIFSADETHQKKKNLNQSIWGVVKSYVDANSEKSLFVKHEKTTAELFEDYRKSGSAELLSVKPLKVQFPDDIWRMIEPVRMPVMSMKTTPTRFSEFIAKRNQFVPVAASPETDQFSISPTEIGTAIHQVFSRWNFRSMEDFLQKTGESLAPFFLSAKEKDSLSKTLSDWAMLVLQERNPLRTLLCSATEIRREVGIIGKLAGVIVEGTIDCLLRDASDSFIIVDFKSDRIGDSISETMLKKYRAQLDLYALLLKKWSGLNLTKHCLYFIRRGKIVETRVNDARLTRTERELSEFIRLQNEMNS